MELDEKTAREVLLGHLLGKVGRLHEVVDQLSVEIPDIQARFTAIADGVCEKLTIAVSAAVKAAETSGQVAGEEAVRNAAQKQVRALVEEVALATADMRLSADGAAASLKRSVAKVSIWRQVAFCVASGAVSGFVIFGLLGIFGQGADRFFVRSVALTASSLPAEDLKNLGSGRMIRGVWPRLSAQCQAEITTASAAAGKAH